MHSEPQLCCCCCCWRSFAASEEVLAELARAVGAGAVYCHGEVTAEDASVEDAVSKALDRAGAALKVGCNAGQVLLASSSKVPSSPRCPADLQQCW